MPYIPKNIPTIEGARKTENRIWIEIIKFLVVSISVNLVMLFVGEIIKKVFFHGTMINENIHMLIQLYCSVIGIGVVIVFCYRLEKRSIKSLGIRNVHVCRQYIKGICVSTLLLMSIVQIGILLNIFAFDGMNEKVNVKIILLFLGGFLLQGLYEEIIFRGYFMISIARKNSIFAAVITNSAIFGATHGLNNGFQLLGMSNLILFGIFESIYFLKTGNIWGISAIHSTWNFMQGSMLGFNVSGVEQSESLFTFNINNCKILSGGTFGPEGSILATMVLICAIIIVMLYQKNCKM